MSKLLAYIYYNQCRELNASNNSPVGETSAPTGDSTKVVISSSVGLRSTNLATDVTEIQKALNRITPGYGGPVTPLVPDGVCGSKTVKAIQDFQLHHFDWKGADGIINPNGETLAKINQILSKPQAAPPQIYPPDAPEVSDAFELTLKIYVAEARRWVSEARMELTALEPFINSLNAGSENYHRLNNVFAVEQSPNRHAVLRKILQVYDDMERAFQRYDGSGKGVFELYRGAATGTTNGGAVIAFTTAAGFYYMIGSETYLNDFGKCRNDKIYMMPSGMVLWANRDTTFLTSVLIHEMAHFVGGWHSVGTIMDWNDQGTLLERLRSANCYQLYADAVHFRTDGKLKKAV